MSEFKPCPFCGGEEIGQRYGHKTGVGYVCMSCEATGPFSYGDAEHKKPWRYAAEGWNTRASEAREADLKAKLGKALEMARTTLPSVTTPVMEGDNLAITLCTAFDDGDSETEDDTGWSEAARLGYEQVIAAIHDHYVNALKELSE